MNFIPTYYGHTADGGTNFFAIFSAMYSHVITVHYGNENSHAIKFDYTKLVAILHISNNSSSKAKRILLNNPRDEVAGIIQPCSLSLT